MENMAPIVKRTLADVVKDNLRKYIAGMELEKNTKLPQESALAKELGVSRVTIRKALDELAQEGVVLRIHGKGTFANPEALHIKIALNPAHGFEQLIHQSGYTARTEVIGQRANLHVPSAAKALGLAPNAPLLVVEKMLFADEKLAIICFDHFSMDTFPTPPTNEAWEQADAFVQMHRLCGHIIARDRIEIETRTIRELCELTSYANQMDCQSVLQFNTTAYNQENRPVMFGRVFYNTNYIRFNLIRNQDIY